MSKKITHIKAKENLKKISWSKGYFEKEEQGLKDYITQQEKQDNYTTNLINVAQHRLEQISLLETKISKKDELLELYRELAYHTRPIIIDDKYVELQQKIKEVENE